MTSCWWILVLGSLIAMQGGRVEASEDDGVEATPQTEEKDVAPPEEQEATPPTKEDGGAEEESPPMTEEPDAAENLDEDSADAPLPVDEAQGPTEGLSFTESVAETEVDPDPTPDPAATEEPEEGPADIYLLPVQNQTETTMPLVSSAVSETPEQDVPGGETEITQDEAPSVNANAPADDDLDLGDALDTSETDAEQDQNTVKDSPAESGIDGAGGADGADGADGAGGAGGADGASEGMGKARSAGAKAGPSDSEESQGSGSGSGTVGGVVGAIGVAIVGAVSGFFAYQKKKLCFKAQERDPERAKEENGAQNDPQVLSNLLNSS